MPIGGNAVMTNNLHCPEPQQLLAFVQGTLAEADSQAIELHLGQCHRCQIEIRSLPGELLSTPPMDPSDRQADYSDRKSNGDPNLQSDSQRTRIESTVDFQSVLQQHAITSSYPFLLPPEEPDEIGRLANYRVLRMLGSGGMGHVFYAEDLVLGRPVALKVMKPELSYSSLCGERFLREARTLAAIKDDHVVTIFQAGQQNDVIYLVMELLKGESLEHRLRAQHPWSIAEIIRLGKESASGLVAIHRQNLIHRDIKPANIWLEMKEQESSARIPQLGSTSSSPESGPPRPIFRVKILDFGLVRPIEDDIHLSHPGALLGTPAYMSPEQARGEPVDARSDLFSLGSMLYEVCTGSLPFKGGSILEILEQLGTNNPEPVYQLNSAIPQALADLVTQLLAKKPEDRPPSAKDVVKQLRVIEQESLAKQSLQTVVSSTSDDKVISHSPNTVDEVNFSFSKPRLSAYKRPMRRQWLRCMILVGLITVVAVIATIWIWSSRSPISSKSEQQQVVTPITNPKDNDLPNNKGKQRLLKVFLLAGQPDMAGNGAIRTLDWLGKDPQYGSLLQKIKNPDGSWAVQDHVWIYYPREQQGNKQGKLTVGFGHTDTEIGPELVFGQVLGDYFPNPILLIKVTRGDLSLAVEGRPPSSGGATGPFYQQMIQTVRTAMINLKSYCPAYDNQGCEIAGFVWFQGWNDMIFADRRTQYESNLVNLIRDVRKDLGVPNLPVVVGDMGVDGKKADATILAFRKIQAAAVNRPEFKGNVALVQTSAYWDEQADALFRKGFNTHTHQWVDEDAKNQFEPMGNQMAFLYFGSGKINALIGMGFGEAMKAMCTTSDRDKK